MFQWSVFQQSIWVLDPVNNKGTGFMKLCLLSDLVYLHATSITIAISLQFVRDEVRENEVRDAQSSRIDDRYVILPVNWIGVV